MKMLNRSLATFMNAMTAPDHTMYPFSTCNEQVSRCIPYILSVYFVLLHIYFFCCVGIGNF